MTHFVAECGSKITKDMWNHVSIKTDGKNYIEQ